MTDDRLHTCASEVVQRQRRNDLVSQMIWRSASRSVGDEAFGSQPVCKPAHVTVAQERVGNQVQVVEQRRRIKRPRGDAANLVGEQIQLSEVVEAPQNLAVHCLDPVLGQRSGTPRHVRPTCRRCVNQYSYSHFCDAAGSLEGALLNLFDRVPTQVDLGEFGQPVEQPERVDALDVVVLEEQPRRGLGQVAGHLSQKLAGTVHSVVVAEALVRAVGVRAAHVKRFV